MTLSYFSRFLRISKLRASTFCCAFSSALLIQGWAIASPSCRPNFCSIASMRSAAEDAHEIVFERQEELGGAGVALTAGAAAQLIVDAAALMPLGADDVEAAGLQRDLLLAATSARIAAVLRSRSAGSCDAGRLLADAHVDVAAELDVGAAAGHVGGDGDARPARRPGR